MIYRIRSYHGGLGDELQFSTLPELFHKEGHEIHLLKHSDEVLPFRNLGIKQFVWGLNPYIKSETNGKWDIGDLPSIKYDNSQNDFIKNWEAKFGFTPINSLPKVYYTPKKTEGIEGLIDTSALSLKYHNNRVTEIVNEMMLQSKIKWRQITTDHQANDIDIEGVEKIKFGSLYEVYDAMCHCQEFISLSSGLHSLAAAARRVNTKLVHTCILPNRDYGWTMDLKKFVYPGINYIR